MCIRDRYTFSGKWSRFPQSFQMNFQMCIRDRKMTILAEVCEWPEEIDGARANEARIRAERRLAEHSPETDIARAEAALRRALVRLSLVEEH